MKPYTIKQFFQWLSRDNDDLETTLKETYEEYFGKILIQEDKKAFMRWVARPLFPSWLKEGVAVDIPSVPNSLTVIDKIDYDCGSVNTTNDYNFLFWDFIGTICPLRYKGDTIYENECN